MKYKCLVVLAFVMGAMAQNVIMLDNGGGRTDGGSFAMHASIGQYALGNSASDWSYDCEVGFFSMIRSPEGIEEDKPLPEGLGLSFSPNPFNSSMEIHFNLDRDDEVEICIFSVTGQRMTSFSRDLKAGSTKIAFKADDKLVSGIYIVRVKTEDKTDTKRAVYVK